MTLKRLREHWPEALTALLGGMWLALFPLWQDGSFTRITRAKWLGALHFTGVTVFVILLSLILLLCMRTLRQHARLHPAQGLALCYFGWVALSAWQGSWSHVLNSSGAPAVWMGSIRYEGLHMHLCYAAIFLSMSLFRPPLKWLLRAVALGLTAFFTVVMLQYAGHNPLHLFPTGLSVRTNYEFQGTIGNIDMVSGYLCLAVPLLLGGFALLRKADPLLLISGLLGVELILMTEVQSGMIALLGGLGLLAIFLLRRPALRWRILIVYAGGMLCAAIRMLIGFPWLDGTEHIIFPCEPSAASIALMALALLLLAAALFLRRHPGKAMPRKWVLILAVGFILICLVTLSLLPLEEGSGLWEIQQILRGNPQDSFGSYRMAVWRHTLTFAKENLLFGTGPDTFYYVMKDHLTRTGASLPETFDNPHNEYLAILSNNGLPALLLYLGMMAALIISCIRRRKNPETLVLAGAVILFMLQGFFSFSICLVTPMFWAICGMACAWCRKDASVDPTF